MKRILFMLLVGACAAAAAGAITVELFDKKKRLGAYDGFEITDSAQKIQVPHGKPEWSFTLADFDKNKFVHLRDRLGATAFAKIATVQKYKAPKTEFETYSGADGLPVYFFTRPDKGKDSLLLFLVSYGEYQPSRYIAHVEGIWRVKGANF